MCIHSIFPAADNIRSVSIPTVLQQWSQLWVGVISVKPVCSVILRTWWSENKRPGEDCPLLAVQCNEIMEKDLQRDNVYFKMQAGTQHLCAVLCAFQTSWQYLLLRGALHTQNQQQPAELVTDYRNHAESANTEQKKTPVSRSYQVHRNMIYHALMHEFTTSRELIKQAKRGK